MNIVTLFLVMLLLWYTPIVGTINQKIYRIGFYAQCLSFCSHTFAFALHCSPIFVR